MVSGVRVWPTTPRQPETESMRGAGVGLVEEFDMRGEGRGWVKRRSGEGRECNRKGLLLTKQLKMIAFEKATEYGCSTRPM
jgi:hypothetical protein